MRNIIKEIKKQEWIYIFLCVITIITQVFFELKIPDYMSEITKLVQTEGSDINEILKNGIFMLLCALSSMGICVIARFCSSKTSAGVSMRLRSKVFNKIMSFNNEEMSNFSTASLITRNTNDINRVQMMVAIGLQGVIKAPIMLTFAITKISLKQWEWSAVVGAAVFIIILMVATTAIFALPRFKAIQKLTDKLNNVTRENLMGIRIVRAYNAEKYHEDKFENVNQELKNTYLFTSRIMSIVDPVMSVIMASISLCVYWIGAYLISTAEISTRLGIFSDMVVFSSYAVHVIMSFMMLIFVFIMFPRVAISVNRINEVLDTDVKMKNGIIKEFKETGSIEFKNVNFKYPDGKDNILENINFKINPGETVAIIGPTASGKSTLINLIVRLFDTTEGTILINGENIKNYDTKALREKIGYVSQKAILFSGNIETNVAYAKENVDKEKLSKAIEIAQAKEFVDNLKEKELSNVAQGGTNLSGGQKQRVSIARAVYKDPEIYIFDDSFSALDYKTDKNLRDALNKHTKNATKIIVAQRIGTIKDADKIIVLEDGKMVGYGKHDELIKSCETYKEIALSQLTEEELKNA